MERRHWTNWPVYGREVNSMFLDIVNEFGIEQQVNECTRENHILDLVFVSQPNTINKMDAIPGMSDHDAVSFEVLTSLEKHKIQRRKIFQFHKADKDGIVSEMHEFCEKNFEHDPYRRTIQDNWHLFKTSIIDIIEKFVPTKVIKPHKDVPWLNQLSSKKMKLRNKLYVHAKRTQVGSDWSAYRHVRNEVNNLMKDAYHNYCTHLFDDSHTNNRKRFWSLIKNISRKTSPV